MRAWQPITKADNPARAFADHLCGLLAQKPADRALAVPFAAQIESVEIVDGVLRANLREHVIACSKPRAKLPTGLPKSLQAVFKAHASITFSDRGGSEWLGLELATLDTVDWPLEGAAWKGIRGPIHQVMRKYSDVYFLHPKKRTKRKELALVFYDHEVGVGRPLERSAGARFLDHLAEHLKLVVTPAKLPVLAKVKLDGERLRFERSKKLVSLSQLTGFYTPVELGGVTALDVSGCALASTAGVELFRNVETLRIDDNVVTDTSGIERLTKLRYLSLKNNRITTLRCSAATELRSVNLEDNRVASLADLELPPGIRELNLHRNAITSLAAIGALPELRELKLYANKLEVIDNLETLPHLEKIALHGNPARDMSAASVEAIRTGRTRGLDALLDTEVEQKYGLVPLHWMLAAACSRDDLEAAALAKWREFLGQGGEAAPWTVSTGTLQHAYLRSPDLVMDHAHHFFSELARALSKTTSGRAYVLDFRPGERRRTGVHGWESFADAKMMFDEREMTSEQLATKLGCG